MKRKTLTVICTSLLTKEVQKFEFKYSFFAHVFAQEKKALKIFKVEIV